MWNTPIAFRPSNLPTRMASRKQDSTEDTSSSVEIDLTSNSSDEENDTLDSPEEFALITWNIDGLDEKNRVLRTEAACQMMKSMNIDIFFLQEVVPETESIINKMMFGYKFISGNNTGENRYYTLTGLREDTVKLLSSRVVEFDETRMDRNLNEALVQVGDAKIRLLNTHLESCYESSSIRVKQLRDSIRMMENSPRDECVIFGGDLNIRKNECDKITFPSRILDVWEALGSRPECKYTWDMLRNDNKFMSTDRKLVRFRFDRLYLKDSVPSKLRPEYFGLIGLERLKPHKCFPSDHWGILSAFKLIKK